MQPVQFDLEGARRAGYDDDQIADALAQKAGFDSNGARQAGFKSVDIINRLAAPQQPRQPTAPINDGLGQLEKPSVAETLLIGAGRTTDRVSKGMQQMWHGMRGNDAELAQLKAEADSDNEQYTKLQKMRPIATAVGESLPSLIVPAGGAATALGAAGRVAAASAIPAALEYGTVEERAKRGAGAAAGGVVGGVVVPKVAGAAYQGTKNSLRSLVGNVSPEAVALAAKAEQAGIKVNAAQLGDSKFLKTLSSALEQMPFTGAAKQASDQRGNFTRAVSKTFGEDADKITPAVYKSAKDRLGQSFDDLAMRNTLRVDDTLNVRLNGILDEARQMADPGTIKALESVVSRLKTQSTTQGKLFHGGTYNVGDDLSRPLFTAEHPDLAKTYVSMATERGMKGAKVSQFDADLKAAAPESVIRMEAKKIGIDPDAGTPASVFDSELHGEAAVSQLVKNLKKIGYDHAKLGDIPYGQGKEFDATVIFPGIKPRANQTGAVELPGAAYSSIDSMLSKAIKGGGEKGLYLKEVQKAVREGMDRSIGEADKAAWNQTRSQYKNLKAVRDIVGRDGGNGDIPPTMLMNSLNSSEAGKEVMAMGVRGELGELGRIGRQFVRDQVPNSGTAQRALAMGLIGGGGFAFGASPQEVAGMLAGGATAGRVMQKVLSNPNVVANLSKEGYRVADLIKLPPERFARILGAGVGRAVEEKQNGN